MTMQSILIGVQRENLFSTITSVEAFGFESASAQYQILGGIERSSEQDDFGELTEEYDWLVPNEFGYNYEVRATLLSGTVPSGTFDTFIGADTTPNWTVLVSQQNDSQFGFIRLDFRRKGDTNILLTKDVFLSAQTT